VFGQVLDEHAHCLRFSYLEVLAGDCLRVDEEVLDLLVVDLKHGDLDVKPEDLGLGEGAYSGENLVTCLWYDALVFAISDHGIALAAACLAVGEKATVVAFPGVVEDLLAQLVLGRVTSL